MNDVKASQPLPRIQGLRCFLEAIATLPQLSVAFQKMRSAKHVYIKTNGNSKNHMDIAIRDDTI